MGQPILDLESAMAYWSIEELKAFFCCVRSSEAIPAPDGREDLVRASVSELFWAYSSKGVAQARQSAAKVKQAIYDYFPNRLKTNVGAPEAVKELDEYGSPLSYEYLVRQICKKSNIQRAHVEPLQTLEVYLIEDLLVRAAAQMNAQQRHVFLTGEVQLEDFSAVFPRGAVGGPATTFVALAIAQGSGFGVYLGATTALGFLSHAIGVTLPFAVYTGMTSTLAFLIGPLGFLGAGVWFGSRVLGPEWPRILRGVLHLIAMRGKYEYQDRPPSARNTSGAYSV